jgi:uncharacterized protein (DUF302 family)
MHHIKSKITLMGATALVLTMLMFASSQNGWAQAEGIKPVDVVANGTFDQTVNNVKKLVAKNGMSVMGEINQGKMLSMTGLKFNGVTLLVGNPTVGKKLFSADTAVGLVVPIRLYIFENKDGKTTISYYKPSELLSQYHNPEIDMVGKMLDDKLEKLTIMAAK